MVSTKLIRSWVSCNQCTKLFWTKGDFVYSFIEVNFNFNNCIERKSDERQLNHLIN